MSDLTLRRKHRVFDLDYWERSMKKYSALVRKLRMGSRGWERRSPYYALVSQAVRMRCDEMVIRNKRDIRRRVAGSVMKSLSCSRLD
ncbi:hypothetical protein PV325_011827, partial [Microctonus aethiopoides]